MLRENTMIKTAATALQAAFAAENSTPEMVQAAFDQFGQAIASTIQADYEAANGDRAILAQRGFRQLTGAEQKYYEAIIEAAKAAAAKQTSFQFQKWYADKGEASEIVLNAAYTKTSAASETNPSGVTLYGDANGDGAVNIMDVILVNKYLLGSAILDAQAQLNADVDNNQNVNSTDSLNILKAALNMLTLPVKK